MLTATIVTGLLTCAALGHLVAIPALALAPRWAILDRSELEYLSPINARIVIVVMGTIQLVLLGSAFTVLWARQDIASGGRLAVATTGCLALLWLGRLIVQVFLYGPLFSGSSLRLLHLGLVALFTFMAASYGLVCANLVWAAPC